MNSIPVLVFLQETYPIFGLIGCFVIVASSLITGLAYCGKNGERFSIRNYFISELGEVGISRLAVVFNLAMILGGALFVLMMVGLGLALNSAWGYLAMGAGIVAGIACAFVGIFPMNNLKPHGVAAMTYFRAGLVTTLLFTVAFFVQPAARRVIPLYTNCFGFLAFFTYLLFLIIAGREARKTREEESVLDTANVIERPRFWVMPFMEWMVFFSTLLWFLVVAVVS